MSATEIFLLGYLLIAIAATFGLLFEWPDWLRRCWDWILGL